MANAGTQPASAEAGSATRAYPRRTRSERWCRRSPAETSQRARSNAGDAGPANSQSMTLTIAPSSIRRCLGSQSPWVSESLGEEISTALDDRGRRGTERLVGDARRSGDEALVRRLEFVPDAAVGDDAVHP